MHQQQVDLVVVGGGPAGMAAAIAADKAGVRRILLLERAGRLGGVLQQCIHTGFGLEYFQQELTGPEYAEMLAERTASTSVRVMLSTTVSSISADQTIVARNEVGIHLIRSRAIVLAMGCRERTRGSILLPGTRPAGVFTAGTAQYLVNMQGYLPGRRAVILGSGDIGLIMARRLTLAGCEVKGVYEINDTPGGLPRNITQCLSDFGIPLHLRTTITFIHGEGRVAGVTIAGVDERRQPIAGTSEHVPCDTVILSVGLIPENELSTQMGLRMDNCTGGPVVDQYRQTSQPGVFACGNVLHVHDLADEASAEGELAGLSAARFLCAQFPLQRVAITPGDGVRSVVPQCLALPFDGDVTLSGRLACSVEHPVLALSTGGGKELARQPLIRATQGTSWQMRLPDEVPIEPLIISLVSERS